MKSKKIAAALAAVETYLQEEKAAAREEPAARTPVQDISAWGLSGRQNMMSMRQLIQMKAFSRF